MQPDTANKIDEKKFAKVMETFKALVVDPNSSSRNALKKILAGMGAKSHNLDVAENYEEALEKMTSTQPRVLFVEYELGDKSGLELAQMQKELFPNQLDTLFGLVTGKGTPSVICQAAEEDVDLIITKPFTAQSFQEEFMKAFAPKMEADNYLRTIEHAKCLLRQQKMDEAQQAFESALTMTSTPAIAYYYLGEIARQKGDLDAAYSSFEKGVENDQNHYKSLVGLFDLCMQRREFEKAYQTAAKILQKHPMSPRKIPDLVRLAIVNNKVEDMDAFYDLFHKLQDNEKVPEIVSHMAAGLVVAGRYFLHQKQVPKALDAFSRAVMISKGKRSIYAGLLRALVAEQKWDEANTWLKKMTVEDRDSMEIQFSIFDIMVGTGNHNEVIRIAKSLLSREVKDIRIYGALIQSSIATKRRIPVIEELVQEASRLFPERASAFQTKLAAYVKEQEAISVAARELDEDGDDDDEA